MSTPLNDTLSVKREAPKPRSFSRPFWEATREKKLLVQFSRGSGKYQFFPRATSIYNGRRDLEWREVSGRGTLYSWTLTLTPWPGHEARVPYICALIDLEEGVRLLANLHNCEPGCLHIGMPVRIAYEDIPGEDVTLWRFVAR